MIPHFPCSRCHFLVGTMVPYCFCNFLNPFLFEIRPALMPMCCRGVDSIVGLLHDFIKLSFDFEFFNVEKAHFCESFFSNSSEIGGINHMCLYKVLSPFGGCKQFLAF